MLLSTENSKKEAREEKKIKFVYTQKREKNEEKADSFSKYVLGK